jgi:hypothetical protein
MPVIYPPDAVAAPAAGLERDHRRPGRGRRRLIGPHPTTCCLPFCLAGSIALAAFPAFLLNIHS